MLSNTALQAILRGKRTVTEKFPDRDGLYVVATVNGTVSFRWNYYMGGRAGRRGTLTIGQYPIVSLAQARERLLEAKKDVAAGIAWIFHPIRFETRKSLLSRGFRHFWDPELIL